MTIAQRPECAADDVFLHELIVNTISAELGALAWPEPMRSQLLGIQYECRRYGHRSTIPETESRIIQADGREVGWLAMAALPHEIRIVDVMIAAKMRGRGIGSAAIHEVLCMANRVGRPVRLHVNVMNVAAIRLYERLGFRRIDGDEVQHLMQRDDSL